MSQLPMKEQGVELGNAYELWKGSNDQLDDVCVIGIKYN